MYLFSKSLWVKNIVAHCHTQIWHYSATQGPLNQGFLVQGTSYEDVNWKKMHFDGQWK